MVDPLTRKRPDMAGGGEHKLENVLDTNVDVKGSQSGDRRAVQNRESGVQN